MTENRTQHQYQVGDAVLVDFNAAMIPGVIQDQKDGNFQVRLAKPWADAEGDTSDTAWVGPDKLSPSLEEETGGEQALPG